MSTSLEIVRIPVLNDNYVWLMREPQSGSVGVVDPAVAGPVLAEAAKRRWKITHILNTHRGAHIRTAGVSPAHDHEAGGTPAVRIMRRPDDVNLMRYGARHG